MGVAGEVGELLTVLPPAKVSSNTVVTVWADAVKAHASVQPRTNNDFRDWIFI